MAAKRTIDPSFWQSESMGQLTCRQRLLFIGLLSNADDQGRLKGHPALIRSTVFPYDDIRLEEVELDLKAIVNTGAVEIYQGKDGRTYIQIINWWTYQSLQWAYPSDLPPIPDWEDRLRYRKEGQIITRNWAEPTSRSYPKDWDAIKVSVFERDNNCCVYCGALADQIDHIIPVSFGGGHSMDNLVASCARCNMSKSDRDVSFWYREQDYFDQARLGYIYDIIGGITYSITPYQEKSASKGAD